MTEPSALNSPIPRADEEHEKIGWRIDFDWLCHLQYEVENTTGDHSTLEAIEETVVRTENFLLAALRAAPAQGEPVAWRVGLLSGKHQLTQERDIADTWRKNGASVEPLYAATSNLAKECAKIAESHVGAGGYPGNELENRCRRIGYDDACRDIAKAIMDTYAHE